MSEINCDLDILKDVEKMKRVLQEGKVEGPYSVRIDDVWYHVDKDGKVIGDPLDEEEIKEMDSLFGGSV